MTRKAATLIGITLAGLITLVALVGIFASASAARSADHAIDELAKVIDRQAQSAARTECARRINAEAEQDFRRAIADLLEASTLRDLERRRRALDRLLAAPPTNELIDQQCPPPLANAEPSPSTSSSSP